MHQLWNRLSNIIIKQIEIDRDEITPELNLLEKKDVIIENYSNDFISKFYRLGAASSSKNIWGNNQYGYFSIDEFKRIELIMAIEEEFDIEISDDILEQIKTMQDLFNVVIACLKEDKQLM